MKLRSILLGCSALVLAAMPAAAQQAKLPTGFVTRINQSTGNVEMQDGMQWVAIGTIDPVNHKFVPSGVAANAAAAANALGVAQGVTPYFAAVATACDTSQWGGVVSGGSSRAVPSCYTTKSGQGIVIPFAATIGVNAAVANDPTYLQLAQHLIQAVTLKDNTVQENGLAINMVDQTGGGGLPQTGHNQKSGLYLSMIAKAGGANAWAFNPVIVCDTGFGLYGCFNSELDMTNFNQPYRAGGAAVAAMVYEHMAGSYPITATHLLGADTIHDTVTANTTAGSMTIVPTKGGFQPDERVTGPGIPAWTNIDHVNADGSTVMTQAATATATGVSITATSFGAYEYIHNSDSSAIRDTFIRDDGQSQTSIEVGGVHQKVLDTSAAQTDLAINIGGGQRVCLNAGAWCFSYQAGQNGAPGGTVYQTGQQMSDDGSFVATAFRGTPGGSAVLGSASDGPLFTAADPGAKANGLVLLPGTDNYGPFLRPNPTAAGSNSIPLNLSGANGGAVNVSSNMTAWGARLGANLANNVSITGNGSGFGPTIQAQGSDANVPLNLQGQGGGQVQALSTFNAGNGLNIGQFAHLPSYTVATLPPCNGSAQDFFVVVSDATSPTYRGALTGGGTVRTPVYCDGSSWTAH